MKEPNDIYIKRLELEINSIVDCTIPSQRQQKNWMNRQDEEETNNLYKNRINIDKVKKLKILALIQKKDIDGLSEEFTKMLCGFALEIIAFAPLGTFENLLQNVSYNQKKCSELTPEELEKLEREENIGLGCALTWIVRSFCEGHQIKPSKITLIDNIDEVLLDGLGVCIDKYIKSVKRIPKKGDQDD